MVGLWVNLVEVWFGIIERIALRRDVLVPMRELHGEIRVFIEG